MLDRFSQNNSSTIRYIKSFTGGVTPSLLLACVAVVGFFLLWIVVKHARRSHMNGNIAEDLDEDSGDEESFSRDSIEQKNRN